MKYTIQEPEKEIVIERRTSASNIWLTVYSDLITNLMVFFLMLFALTRLKTNERDRIYKALKSDFSAKKTVRMIDEAKPNEQEVKERDKISYVEENEEHIKFTFSSPVLFDSGSAELKPTAFGALDLIKKQIESSDYPVIVEGHTDNVPIRGGKYPSNWHLSAARAFSVIHYFMRSSNILPQRLSAYGYGEFNPVAPNDTEENKIKNRRIEIILVKK
jgi:chemotaxis protein MotB